MPIIAVKKDPWDLFHVPDHFTTLKICDGLVCGDLHSLLQSVPDLFVTQEKVELWHDVNDLMFNFKFGQKKITSKKFYKQKQVTEIFIINVNKVVLSDRVSCSNGKEWWFIVGYQVDGETTIPLFIKTPKKIFSYRVSMELHYEKGTICKEIHS